MPARRLSLGPVMLLGIAALAAISGGAAVAAPAPDPVPSQEIEDDGDTTDTSLEVTVTPSEGEPGTSFTAIAVEQGIGLECTTVTFSWEYDKSASNSGMTATFTVPAGANPHLYRVTGTCDGDQRISRTAEFTILGPTPDPSLTLDRTEGPPGTSVTATVTDCTDAGSLSWDGDAVLEGPDGPFTIPADAAAGPHTVSVSCASDPEEATFTVVPPASPTLELSRSDGPPGAEITASGTGFACRSSQVQLAWDDGTAVTTASGSSGSFTQPVTSPSTAGDHQLTASCTDNPEIAAQKPFTVTEVVASTTEVTASTASTAISTPTPSATVTAVADPPVIELPPPPPRVPPWVIALFVMAALLAAAGYRNWRKLQIFRVHAVVRPDGQPTMTLREEPGQRTHAVRVRVNAGTAQHTIERGER